MKILAIDPGTTESGWVYFDKDTHKVLDKGINENNEVLELIETFDPDVLLLEMIASYGMPVGKTTMETIYWIGRFYQQGVDIPVKKRLYKKIDINPTICGSNKAKDKNIRAALLDMFPGDGGGRIPQIGLKSNQGPLYGVTNHMWAALALVMTYLLQENLIKRVY